MRLRSTDVKEKVHGFLHPICAIGTFHLRRMLEEDCGLFLHLDAIEGLLYMRGHDVMRDWAEWLFTQVGHSVIVH